MEEDAIRNLSVSFSLYTFCIFEEYTDASGKLIAFTFNIRLSIVYSKSVLISPCPLIIKEFDEVN